jgi:polysaccharide export outer membrane protein
MRFSGISRTALRAMLPLILIAVGGLAPGQNLQAQPSPAAQTPAGSNAAQSGAAVRPDYTLGANDQILLRTPGVVEINEQPFRINAEGFLELPIVGRVKAAGMTIRALEADLVNRLREFVREPQVYISLVQFRSEPVFFVGAFRNPGLYPLQGGRGLIEMMSSVGGLIPNAGHRIRITRRSEYGPIPLPNAIVNNDRKISTIDISLESLTQNINPEEDIVLQPYDVVSAEQSERIYVTGDVVRSAAIELGQRSSLSVAQALTEAGGFSPGANRDKLRVLRPIIGTNRRSEIVIDMKSLLAGRIGDFPLLPNDILYVSRSSGRVASTLLSGTVSSLPYIILTAILR